MLARAEPAWPDWSGEAVAIIASGPSAKGARIDLLRDRMRVIAVKANVDLCPWADVVYGCDGAWWKSRRGLPDFSGLKLTWAADATTSFADIRKVEIPDVQCDRLLFDKIGTVGAGGNSGFQALNLAVQFGARRILLIGFDMHGRSGAHWYGRNNWDGANNPSEDNYRRWLVAFLSVSEDLVAMGVEVVNASSISVLTCFRRATIEQTLEAWA